jgi:putative nucleotidyltransferase with HDIG domain
MYTNVNHSHTPTETETPFSLEGILSHASLAGHAVLSGGERALTRMIPLFRSERLMVSHVRGIGELDAFMLGSHKTMVIEVISSSDGLAHFSRFAQKHPEVLFVALHDANLTISGGENLCGISSSLADIDEAVLVGWRTWADRVSQTLESRLGFLEALLPSYTARSDRCDDLALMGQQIDADFVGFIGAEGEHWWSSDTLRKAPQLALRPAVFGVMTPIQLTAETVGLYLKSAQSIQHYRTLVVPVDTQQDRRSFVIVMTKRKTPWSLDLCAQLRILGQSRAFRCVEPDGEGLDVVVELLVQTLSGKDGYTAQHSDRVAILAREVALEMQLCDDDVQLSYLGGRLHDIGKLWVDDHFLTKPGPLTPDEYESLKTHTTAGYALMNRFERLRALRDTVLSHHERMDGRGYPQGLKGNCIPLIARIVSVADAYDAMTTDRSYRRGRPSDQALEELNRCSGAQFDSTVVDAFNRVFRRLEIRTYPATVHSAVSAR